MKYKYIPKPILKENQEAKPLYDLQKDVFIVGWAVGHYEEIKTEEDLPEDLEPQKEWIKDYEAMELSPEEEAEWEKEQLKPTEFDKIEAQTLYTALITDTLIEEE